MKLDPSARAILQIVRDAGRPLTFTEIMTELKRRRRTVGHWKWVNGLPQLIAVSEIFSG